MENNHNYLSDEDLAAFLDGNVDELETASTCSSLSSDYEASTILALSPNIDFAVETEMHRILPVWALAAANPQNMCSFDCEIFILKKQNFDIDHWSLLETAKANNWLREFGTPLHHVGRLLELKGMHVERKYDAGTSDLAEALDNGRHVIAIVDKNIMEGKPAEARPRYHAIYIRKIDDKNIYYISTDTGQEQLIAIDKFLKAWECSGNYMVGATLSPAGYNPQPIDVSDIDLDADLEDLTEAIAENAHDIWARARMNEGWTYGPERNDDLKQHPDLVPYARLADSEKEYDRIMAMNTIRLVRRLGFAVYRPS